MSTGTEDAEAMDRLAKAIEYLADQGGNGSHLMSGEPELLPVYLALAGMAMRKYMHIGNSAEFLFNESGIAEMVPPPLRRMVIEQYFRYNDVDSLNLWLGKRG